ncbi:MAG: betaine/proline/choline family ABC transporter ATP-binding protein [Oceanospirillaceae bacterium]|nr:betaine/proline/choline family ABC transporter ATP-binding protein [Oceanospirillaceae bacterium]
MIEQKTAKIKIENLSKIFGPKAASLIPLLEQGIDRQTMQDKYQHVLALDNINMDLAENSIEVIMGLSGSGKSTLIRHINRLIDPTVGSIMIDGENVCQMSSRALREFRQTKTAMVFQNFSLLPHRTVIDNIAFGLQMQKKPAKLIAERCHYWLEKVGLKGFEKNYPAQLSGGMQQRVGLARALACDADILMMDEAFSALDPLIRSDMQDILLGLQKEIQKTIVFITHDLDEALKIGDRIAILNHGKLIQQGTAEQILMHPADDYVSRFVADVNRTTVLRARSIMRAHSQAPAANENTVTVLEDDTIQEVLHSMLTADSFLAVVTDKTGKAVGRIDSDMVAAAVNS